MKLFFRLLLVSFGALSCLSAYATKDRCPVINTSTIVGTWEAVFTEDTIRVFRLEILENGQGLLSQGLGHGRSAVSKLESVSISKGKIQLSLKNGNAGFKYIESGKEIITKGEDLLSGVGYACNSESGVLELVLQMEPNLPSPKKWKLRFIKFPANETLTQALSEMANVAKAAAISAK